MAQDMEDIVAAADRLSRHGVHLFFKHECHFLNPLVAAEAELLRGRPELSDPTVLRVVLELLPGRLGDLERGIYSPVPIARRLDEGADLEELLSLFRYEMIRVDEDQEWWWQERKVAARIKSFFCDHMSYEPALALYSFEYRVNPDWWDKCYFDAQITPMLARTSEQRDGELHVTLNNGRSDRLDLDTLRLDRRERLFCRSDSNGEVLFSDTLRFALFKGLREDCESVSIGDRDYRLRWP